MKSGYIFANRTAVVTGGAGDIGSATCRALHRRGMNVVIADLNEQGARELERELGERAQAVCGDLTDEAVVDRLFEKTKADFGGLDVLINNMGMTDTRRFHTRPVDSITREIEVIMVAPLVHSRLAVPLLQQSDDPRIVTITSLGGITPLRETPIYTAAKFGLRGAMLSFALDVENHGIKVSCVLPTATDTYMLRQEVLDGGSPLNFIDQPQPVSAVVKQVVRQLDDPVLERYPKKSDSFLARFGMLFPNLQPRLVKHFEKRGRKGMAKYLQTLHDRGLLEKVDGELRQKSRAHLARSGGKAKHASDEL